MLHGACAQGQSAAPAAQRSGLQPGVWRGAGAPPSRPCISCQGSAAACGAAARAPAAASRRACGAAGAMLAPVCCASPAPGAAPCAAPCMGPSEVWSTAAFTAQLGRLAARPHCSPLLCPLCIQPPAALGTVLPLPQLPGATERSLPRRGAAAAQPHLCKVQCSHARSRRPSSRCAKGASL
jgi:hypothetical protein